MPSPKKNKIFDEESGKILKSPDTVNPKPAVTSSQSFHETSPP